MPQIRVVLVAVLSIVFAANILFSGCNQCDSRPPAAFASTPISWSWNTRETDTAQVVERIEYVRTCATCSGDLACPVCDGPMPAEPQQEDSQSVPADFVPRLETFQPYNEWYATASQTDGTYYLLASATWCEPCQALKSEIELADPPFGTIGVCDYDADRQAADVFLNGRTLPQLIRVSMLNGKIKRREYWNRNVQSLQDFFRGVRSNRANRAVERSVLTTYSQPAYRPLRLLRRPLFRWR